MIRHCNKKQIPRQEQSRDEVMILEFSPSICYYEKGGYMPIFVRNLGLEYLIDQNGLSERALLEMYAKSVPLVTRSGRYDTYELPGNVLIIFKSIMIEDELRIIGTDTHYKGSCVWTVHPFMDVTPKHADILSKVIACSDLGHTELCVLHLMYSAALETLEKEHPISVQVAVFPFKVTSYVNRSSYEHSVQHKPLHDGRLLSIGFLAKRDPRTSTEEKNLKLPEDVVRGCGRVMSVVQENCSAEAHVSNGFVVATIATLFGPLDVICAPEDNAKPGRYIEFHGLVSAIPVMSDQSP
jgi:hypothetical protein